MPTEPALPAQPAPGEGAGSPAQAALATSPADAALLASFLRTTIEAMTDGVVVCDLDGHILHMNAAMRAFYEHAGVPVPTTVTMAERQATLDLRRLDGTPLPKDEWPLARLVRGEVLSGAEALQVRVQLPDGTAVVESLTGAPLRDDEGRQMGAVCVMRDITETQRLTQRMHERASQLETIFEAMTDAVFIYDAHAQIVEMNGAARTLLAAALDPTHERRCVDERAARYALRDEQGHLLPREQWPMTRIIAGESLIGDRAADIVITNLADQAVRISYAGAPVRDDAGRIIGAVGVCRDVTQRRQAEKQSSSALDVLLAIARLLGDPSAQLEIASLLARVADILSRLEAVDFVHAMVVEGNRLVPVRMVGVSPEVEARWRDDIASVDLARVPHQAEILAHVRGGHIFVQRLDHERPVLSSVAVDANHAQAAITGAVLVDGEVRALLTLSRSRPPDPASASGFAPWDEDLLLGVSRLLGEALAHAAREVQLRRAETARAVAEETTRERDEFIGIAGHELRTPLTTISANAQLLDRGLRQARELLAAEPPALPAVETRLDRLAEQVGRISRRSAVLARLINDLVDVSRLHAQRLELARRPCDLAAILREVVTEQRQIGGEREIRLEGLAPGAVLSVRADPDRIGQVLTNLCTNALKYAPPATSVSITVTADQERVRVAIRDEGPGLTAEQQHRVWERFYRVPGIEVQSGSGVGLGLGLYISREIVERHGGTIGVESTPGHGSTFWFTLPLDRAEHCAAPVTDQ